MVDHRIGTFLALRSKVNKIITVSYFLKEELIKRYFVDFGFLEHAFRYTVSL